ncbi:putative pectinesterase 29 [Gossypium australe]|uniref:Putative pectinesterase 29 n=1 Tax=Gossypium australe TaxID=47621 RepID=A0A5B6WYG9_9ROSI|nr:putative pectinesterase 29 [Gossypium australe]
MIPREQNSAGTSERGQDIGFFTRSGVAMTLQVQEPRPLKKKTLAVEHKREKRLELNHLSMSQTSTQTTNSHISITLALELKDTS